jgi:ribosomal protein S12 methylthiotransferase accessory factor
MQASKHYQKGAHLLVDPNLTLARVKPYMSAMGITRIANVTGLDRIGIPVVMVCRPNSHSIAVSQGKGFTLDAAKASGLMESIESWHAEHIELPLKLGNFDNLSVGHRMINIECLPVMRDSLYHSKLPILWIEGTNLVDETSVWLPHEIVHTFYAHPVPSGSGCFAQSSNGLASGNHYLEAVSHAICECVERDSTSLWHHKNQIEKDALKLDLTSVDDEISRELITRLQAANLAVTVWNTTSDSGIPSFDCILLDPQQLLSHPGMGAGCHPCKSIALVRALTEAAQVRTTYIAGSRDDLTHQEFKPAELEQKNQLLHRTAGGNIGVVDFTSIADRQFATFDEDVNWMLAQLVNIGIDEVVCVDLSKPAFDIPVVRIVIPGLEGPHDEDEYIPGPRARAIAEQAR